MPPHLWRYRICGEFYARYFESVFWRIGLPSRKESEFTRVKMNEERIKNNRPLKWGENILYNKPIFILYLQSESQKSDINNTWY